MRLALGKFSPENFSHFSKAFTDVEVDLAGYLKWDPRDRLRFRKWIHQKQIGVMVKLTLRTDRTVEEFEALQEAASDEFADRLGFWVIGSGRRRFDQDHHHPAHTAFKRFSKDFENPYFFEWGEEDTLLSTLHLKEAYPHAGMILDADYHSKFIPKWLGPLHFKIHGWHPDRWMRRYGLVQIPKLLKRMHAHPDSVLILSHSGRIEEAAAFKGASL